MLYAQLVSFNEELKDSSSPQKNFITHPYPLMRNWKIIANDQPILRPPYPLMRNWKILVVSVLTLHAYSVSFNEELKVMVAGGVSIDKEVSFNEELKEF